MASLVLNNRALVSALKVQEQIEHMTARMQEHHRSQAGIQKSITEVKTTISEKKAYTVGIAI